MLGCSGGIGRELRTTSLLIDGDILIDAGSGVGDLNLDEMAQVRHVFLTHSHLDHINFLPLLVDSIFDRIDPAIVVHGQPATLKALRDYIFNWHIWPDFAALPTPENPVLRYEEMLAGTKMVIGDRIIEMIPVSHIVPAVGYRVEQVSSGGCFAFSGDTASNDTFWCALNQHARLDLLIVEAAFANEDEELSIKARHYCSKTLAADIVKLKLRPPVYLSHTKPGEDQVIYAECTALLPEWTLAALKSGDTFQL